MQIHYNDFRHDKIFFRMYAASNTGGGKKANKWMFRLRKDEKGEKRM